MPPARRLARVPEAANYSGLSERHVRELIHRRRVAHTRVGRVVLVNPISSSSGQLTK
ncbi:MAG: excisionase family DNA-binding protein [Acidimicrobiales bacterium]